MASCRAYFIFWNSSFFWIHTSVSTLEEEPIDGPETSVSNHLTLCNNPADERIHFNRGGSLRSRVISFVYLTFFLYFFFSLCRVFLCIFTRLFISFFFFFLRSFQFFQIIPLLLISFSANGCAEMFRVKKREKLRQAISTGLVSVTQFITFSK
jgi:hypothetical protein